MSDLIKREDAIEAIEFGITYAKMISADGWTKPLFENENRELRKAIERIKDIPSAEKQGKWIMSDIQSKEDTDNGNYQYICSVCGHGDIHARTQEVPYCWWCGARMRGADDE